MKSGLTREDILELNKQRRNLYLNKIIEQIGTGQKESIKKMKVFHNNKEIQFNEIDFTKDCVFITPIDLLGIISYYGLLRINKVDIKDDTITGDRSRIKTNYMIVTALDAKVAHHASDLTEDDLEGWFLENYSRKDLVIWSFQHNLGTGTLKESTTIINSVRSLYETRKYGHKLNWMFYIGNETDFIQTFGLPPINTYILSMTGVVHKSGFISKPKTSEEVPFK